MEVYGAPFDHPVLRAVVRFAAFTVPACYWLWRCRPPGRDRLGIVTHWQRGVAVGVGASALLWLAHSGMPMQLPFGVHAWLNVIVLSPIAEELLFRRVAVDYLTTRLRGAAAIVISALLFAGMHVPLWLISGEKSALEMAQLGGLMFIYGLAFGLLYLWTRSLWSSLLPHSVNNLIAESLSH
ncbi:MAG: hypothetical protein Hals2KO_18010 [Halioglobus sp.]